MTIISAENKIVLVKRLKSLLWRAGAMAVALLVNESGELLNLFILPGWAVVLSGIILGELTKMLNSSK